MTCSDFTLSNIIETDIAKRAKIVIDNVAKYYNLYNFCCIYDSDVDVLIDKHCAGICFLVIFTLNKHTFHDYFAECRSCNSMNKSFLESIMYHNTLNNFDSYKFKIILQEQNNAGTGFAPLLIKYINEFSKVTTFDDIDTYEFMDKCRSFYYSIGRYNALKNPQHAALYGSNEEDVIMHKNISQSELFCTLPIINNASMDSN